MPSTFFIESGGATIRFSDLSVTFSDGTKGTIDLTRAFAVGLPDWWLIFDYLLSNLRRELVFTASRPWDPSVDRWRAARCTWPPGASTELGLTKLEPLLDVGLATSRRYGLASVPSTFFIDASGVIRHIQIGEMDEEKLRKGLDRIR